MTKKMFFQNLNTAMDKHICDYSDYKIDIAVKSNGKNELIEKWLSEYKLEMDMHNQLVEVWWRYDEEVEHYWVEVRQNDSPDFYYVNTHIKDSDAIEFFPIKLHYDGDSDEENSDDENEDPYEDVYEVREDVRMLNKEGKPIKGTYYKTYGGGPEGGYLITSKKVYIITRTWGEPFTVKKVCECKVEDVEFIEENRDKGIQRQIYVP